MGKILSFLKVIVVVSVTATVIAGLWFWSLPTQQPPPFENFLVELQGNMALASQTGQEFNLSPGWHLRAHADLVSPETYLPSGHRLKNLPQENTLLETVQNATPPKNSGPNWKSVYVHWLQAHPEARIPTTLWQDPPLIHPLGGSWAYYLRRTFGTRIEELKIDSAFYHLFELSLLPLSELKMQEREIAQISQSTWLEIFLGQFVFVTNGEAWVRMEANQHAHRYLRLPWLTFTSSLGNLPYELTDKSSNCIEPAGDKCWSLKSSYQPALRIKVQNLFLASSLLSLVAFCFLAIILFREVRRLTRNRQIVALAMAHELRHPVTILQLSLETLRSEYDSVSEAGQVEILRLLTEARRLRRIVDMSERYLSGQKNTTNLLRPTIIPSVADLLQRLARDFNVDFTADPNGEVAESSIVADPYWLMLCVENLVKNALHHGEKPVVLRLRRNGSTMCIDVIDSGKGIGIKITDALRRGYKGPQSKGYGFGLSLTNELCQMMGGQLQYKQNPSTFSIVLEA